MTIRIVARALSALTLFAALSSQAYVFTVGNTPDCAHSTLDGALQLAALSAGEDQIRLTNTVEYRGIAAKINNLDIEIIGGYESCSSPTPTGDTILDGFGGTKRSVIEIRNGGVVRLSRLQITNGDETDDSDGGGIDYKGYGELILDRVWIAHNRAGYGGGIYFNGRGAGATLTLLDNIIIQSNTATYNGGGIHLSGRAKLNMIGTNNAVLGNTAYGVRLDTPGQPVIDGHGGGIYIKTPATADIGAAGVFGSGNVFAENEARLGGAIAFLGDGDGHSSQINIFSAHGNQPIRLFNNRATEKGGAIYARPTVTGTVFKSYAYVDVCLTDTSMVGNTAPKGAAAYLDNHDDGLVFGSAVGATMHYNSAACLPPQTAAVCTRGISCSEVADNRAINSAGAPSDGAIIQFDAFTEFSEISNLNAHGNHAQSIVKRNEDTATLAFPRPAQAPRIQNCLIWGNELSQYVLDFPDHFMNLHQCTIADNLINSNYVLRIHEPGNDSSIVNSIIDQPYQFAVNLSGRISTFNVSHVMTSSPFNNPPPSQLKYVSYESPRFVAPSLGDYRLRPDSPAIDYGRYYNDGLQRDIAGNNRNVDLPKPNVSGFRDLGAYEMP
jgi:predicted outer membrane repeat protein